MLQEPVMYKLTWLRTENGWIYLLMSGDGDKRHLLSFWGLVPPRHLLNGSSHLYTKPKVNYIRFSYDFTKENWSQIVSSPTQFPWKCLVGCRQCVVPLGTETWCVLPTACQWAYILSCSSSSIGSELSVMSSSNCSSSSPSRSSIEIRAIAQSGTVSDCESGGESGSS